MWNKLKRYLKGKPHEFLKKMYLKKKVKDAELTTCDKNMPFKVFISKISKLNTSHGKIKSPRGRKYI